MKETRIPYSLPMARARRAGIKTKTRRAVPWRTPVEFDGVPPRDIPAGTPIWLDANGPAPAGFGRYRHARFMPKHLIQARDELVAVRVERLQDVSEADALAEGIVPRSQGNITAYFAGVEAMGRTAVGAYSELWEHIKGPGSWDANPWVWVLIFKVINL